MHMTREEVALVMAAVFGECESLRKAGEREYAGGENAFGNFVRLAAELDTTPEKVLWTYAMKHKDGIAAHIRGHRSQREPIEGRINDLIVYLIILRAMMEARKPGLDATARPGVPDWEDLGLLEASSVGG